MIGIYKVENLVNHKAYIGQSKYIEKRWNKHQNEPFNPNSHSYDYPLYRAIRKYGIENFSFEVLEECEISELNAKEIYYIEKFDTFYNGYNQTVGGDASASIEKERILGIISDLKNTDMFHKEIAEKWNVSIEMVQGINTGRYWKHNIEYPIQTKKKPRLVKKENITYLIHPQRQRAYCIDCGKEITYDAQRCIDCKQKHSRKVERPTAEELKNKLIKLKSFTAAGKYYGVSGKMVSKWCGYYNMPTHIADYRPIKEEKVAQGITYPKKVQMIDVETNKVVQSFNSIEDAYRHLGVQSSSHIGYACTGKRKTAYGYKWQFVEKQPNT